MQTQKTSAGIGVLNTRRTVYRLFIQNWRYFCLHSMAKLSSLGVVIAGGLVPTGAVCRYANLL